jgi:competence protein ComEA
MADEKLRTLAIVCVVGALFAVGVISLRGPAARPAAPCAQPREQGDLLRCDGVGDPVGARAWLVLHKLDVNAARLDDLTALPRVGPKMARRILDERNRRGGFRDIGELRQVKGIGAKTLARLKPLVTVSTVPLDEAHSRPSIDGSQEPADVAAP